ncbi:putative glycosyltransferase [Pleurocapsa sp. PCC 7327]|uniref:glycosyltransferase family 2 protein n=1 Tax=Pleurocapsa sp. PCC 7327 TaxID=118163 RepID=UPI00029F8A19|nr:glycosyltransferase family 2 protein [Pleurocapsa sp. PCC 7327]AFY77845.1 putative glycosyltransferase [Pleurocapsa sp. PCC 7327]
MRLAIIIINYRTPKLVIDCLASLQTEIEVGRDAVAIVDNASADDSIAQIEGSIAENGWSQWVKVIASPVNGGFSAGNNLGIAALTADAYLLLNSDTIVRPGAIAKLLVAKDDHPEAGIIGPRLEWLDGTPQRSCFRYHSPIGEFIDAAATGPITKLLEKYEVSLPVADAPIEPDWISFACVLIRREVIERVGSMDEGYFMYFDDTDYCRRVRRAGWKILHYPYARVVHLRGGSSSVKSAIATRKRPPAYLYASRSRYYRKFYGAPGLWMANLFWLAGRSVSLVRELAGNRQSHISEQAARDIWTNWRNPLQSSSLSVKKSQIETNER